MNPIAAEAKNTKSTRLSIRATDAEKQLLEQAASQSRVTASQFVMDAALRSAEKVLSERTHFVVSPAEWEAFATLLERPARTLSSLRVAACKPSPFSAR